MARCKHCNEEIASNAKTCPYCGTKNNNIPIWPIALVAIMVITIILKGHLKKTTFSTDEKVVATTATEESAVTIEEQTIYNDNDVIIRVVDLEKSGSDWNVNFIIENNSESNLDVHSFSNAVNGIMTRYTLDNSIIPFPYGNMTSSSINTEVWPGKKAYAALSINSSFFKQYGITADNIRCIDIMFDINDKDKGYIFNDYANTGQIEIKTSQYDGTHDIVKGENLFAESKITVDYLETDKNNYSFVVGNYTGNRIVIRFNQLSINDFTVSSSSSYSFYLDDVTILDGCQTVYKITVDDSFLEKNKIEKVNSIEWTIEVTTLEPRYTETTIGPIRYEVK